jgi:hypothetical protein
VAHKTHHLGQQPSDLFSSFAMVLYFAACSPANA